MNLAASLDGKIALGGGRRLRISTEEDFRRVHFLRNEMDAVIVGVNTVIKDNPSLLVKDRYVDGDISQPLRIVLDSRGRTPSGSRVLSDNASTLIAIARGDGSCLEESVLSMDNVQVLRVEEDGSGTLDLASLFGSLFARGVGSALVEGGSSVISYMIRKGLFDIFTVYYRNIVIGDGSSPSMVGPPVAMSESEVVHLGSSRVLPMEDGFLVSYQRIDEPL